VTTPDDPAPRDARGAGTRVVHAGLPPAADGEPLLPGPVFASLFHLAGDIPEGGGADGGPLPYARYGNPTWRRYEEALSGLEGGEAVLFSSGMAAVWGVLGAFLAAGDVLVAPVDGYPGIRELAEGPLARLGVEVRLVPSETEVLLAAVEGARIVWAESPSNPGLTEVDVGALAGAAHAAGALLAVDGTLATPLRRRPLEHGADLAMSSASKHLTGHSDLVLGYVAARDPEHAAALRRMRTLGGGIPGPFEAWLAHRSLATLDVRLERQERTAAALVAALEARGDVRDVRYPGFGSVVCFTLASADAARAFLGALTLVVEATSFGGVHSTAERRGRWPADAVPAGFIRFSIGVESPDDVLADVLQSLDASR